MVKSVGTIGNSPFKPGNVRQSDSTSSLDTTARPEAEEDQLGWCQCPSPTKEGVARGLTGNKAYFAILQTSVAACDGFKKSAQIFEYQVVRIVSDLISK